MNLFQDLSGSGGETTTVLFESPCTRIERIVSTGQVSPDGFWYDQEEDEFVTVLQGSAVLRIADRKITLQTGDTCLLPAHQKHRVDYTSSLCVWLCVFAKRDKENEL